MTNAPQLRQLILEQVRKFYQEEFPEREFVPGKTYIPASGKVFDGDEMAYLVDASLDFWLTTGRFAQEFERDFQKFFGLRSASLCNSGSSANLLAISALCSPKLGKRRLKEGDEVITVAAGFPTTVNPIVQNRLTPVFVDVDLTTFGVDVNALEAAITPQTKAIALAHTLGNPFRVDEVAAIAKHHGLWLIEDNCDALGSKYAGKLTGTYGHVATVSFYPAHHITMGEGGCVLTDDFVLEKIIRSYRDWGRDCWCDPGKDNTCGKRFDWQLGDLPDGYDHKYIYSHIGYNLKLTDMQAAVGVAQLKKLEGFIRSRRENWQRLYDGLRSLNDVFILPQPTSGSEPSWFGFPLTIRDGAPFSRRELTEDLEKHKIGTRLVFGGDITKQPAYKDVIYRISGKMDNTESVLKNSFWIGVFPGISQPMMNYMIETVHEFVRLKVNA